MQNKSVIRLKNIIFLKALLLAVLSVIIIVVIVILKNKITANLLVKRTLTTDINNNRSQLQSIQKFKQNLKNTNYDYKKLLNHNHFSCNKTAEQLISAIKQLDTKYKLFAPAQITKISDVTISNSLIKNHHVNIRYDKIILKFGISDYSSLLNLSDELYKAMPCGSFVLSYHIKKVDFLTPEIIATLNTYKAPDTIQVKIIIFLQNIIYNEQ
ncbi:MAG: hypothetical protein AB8B66_00685 [Rickettsiaceae bacterium]